MEELPTSVSPKVLGKYCPNVNCASNISCNMPECNRIDSLQNKHATILKRKDIKLLKKRYRDYILCNKVYSFTVLHFTIKFSYDNTPADTKIWSFHLGKLVRWSISHVGRMSPYVREPKTVLDSGLHAVDSGFQLVDSSLFQWNLDSGFRIPILSRIPDSLSCIPDSKALDSRFLKEKCSWILESKSKNITDSGIRIPLHGAKNGSSFKPRI